MSRKQLWNPKYRTAVFPTVVARGLAVKRGANQGEFVVVDDADTDDVAGIVELAATAAKRAGTIFEEGGGAYGTAGEAIAKGDRLTVNDSGEIVKIGTTAGTYHCIGIADEAAADEATVRFRFSKFSVTIS